MDPTIDYYNLNAENFIEGTQNVDMHQAQDRFLQLLDENASILDFGCGSGRDTRYFLDKGYQVTATDDSAEICRLEKEDDGDSHSSKELTCKGGETGICRLICKSWKLP